MNLIQSSKDTVGDCQCAISEKKKPTSRMTRPQGDHLVFEPAEEVTNLLFQELEMVQPAFYSGESTSVQSELTQEVIIIL